MSKNIGFISTRFAGTDGVSLESAKWAEVLQQDGHACYWYSGLSNRAAAASCVVPEAYFGHSANEWINQRIWRTPQLTPDVSARIREMADALKATLYDFVRRYRIDLVVPQNILAIPMHVPLGIAMSEFLAETQMPAIAHHHDFYWERERFRSGAVGQYLQQAFPPVLPCIRHVVINTEAQRQCAARKNIDSLVIPNVFDFASPAPQPDAYNAGIRDALGIGAQDVLVLQPTRIVPRKGIEHAIRLVSLLGRSHRCKLVLSHEAGDEGLEYRQELEALARTEGVELIFFAAHIGEERGLNADGSKRYTLWDLYPHADFVTYPSTYEGFGNALLEAVYFKKPVLVNRYPVFVQDIEPLGFEFALMDGEVTPAVADDVRDILASPARRERMVAHNHGLAARHYSYAVLRERLRTLTASLP